MVCYLCNKDATEFYSDYFCIRCKKIQDIMKLYPNVLETLQFCYIRNEKQVDNKKELVMKKKVSFADVLSGVKTRSKTKELNDIESVD